MALGCCAKFAKALLIVFNLIFWISGGLLVALGTWLLVDKDKKYLLTILSFDNSQPVLQYLAYGLIAIGGFVLVVGFFGCCGALKESKCLLGTYFVLLLLVLAGEAAVGVIALMHRKELLKTLQVKLQQKLQSNYSTPGSESFTQAMDYTQYKFTCCGVLGAEDYSNSKWKSNSGQAATVPDTCCQLNEEQKQPWIDPKPLKRSECQSEDKEKNKNYRHQTGCFEAVKTRLQKEGTHLIIVGLGLAGFEVLGMIFALCLCMNIRGVDVE